MEKSRWQVARSHGSLDETCILSLIRDIQTPVMIQLVMKFNWTLSSGGCRGGLDNFLGGNLDYQIGISHRDNFRYLSLINSSSNFDEILTTGFENLLRTNWNRNCSQSLSLRTNPATIQRLQKCRYPCMYSNHTRPTLESSRWLVCMLGEIGPHWGRPANIALVSRAVEQNLVFDMDFRVTKWAIWSI